MKIKRLEARAIPPHESDFRKSWLSETRIANPMTVFSEFAERRSLWQSKFPDVAVRVVTEDGVTGYGIATGGAAAAEIIETHFARLLVGRDARDIRRAWDIMFRASLPYGRKGLPVMALSGVDIALWDAVSKGQEEPLYRLLGGKTKERLPLYVTGNDFRETKEMGFFGYKLAMPCGVADGLEGLRQNERLIAEARETVGDDAEIMLDCYMSWDVAYTLRMAEVANRYRVLWIEEALPPDNISGYAELRRKLTTPMIVTGEHEYTRYGHKELLLHEASAILQPDVNWVGGITETQAIASMASAFDLPVVPHAGGLQPWAVHLMFANVNCPFGEYFTRLRTSQTSHWWSLHRQERGYLYLSDEPGVGLGLSQDVMALFGEA